MKEQIRCLTVYVYGAAGYLEEERRMYLDGKMPLTIDHGVVRRSQDAGKANKELEILQAAPQRPFKVQRRKNHQRKQKEIAKA